MTSVSVTIVTRLCVSESHSSGKKDSSAKTGKNKPFFLALSILPFITSMKLPDVSRSLVSTPLILT